MKETGHLHAALVARYGSGAVPNLSATPTPLVEQLLAHRSVRRYLPSPLPVATLETLIAAAQSASTSSHLQVWSVVAVEDSARKARLSELAGSQAHIREAPLFLVWLADLSRVEAQAAGRGVHAEGLEFLEALLLGVIDAALAAQNAVVALESMGLAVVYIGGIRNQTEKVALELGLPPRVFPVFGMCVGYEDAARPASVKPRLPQAAVLHREQYSAGSHLAVAAGYDQTMSGFYAAQGMPQESWSGTCVNRLRTPAALHGREGLRSALHQLGFVLR
jgi:nitroreductase